MIRIKAFDTLFFRDNKPFTLGQETTADSVFPPMPSVYYGALRSTYLARNFKSITEIDGENDESKNLKILGVYYASGSSDDINELNVYVPIPLDLVIPKDSSSDDSSIKAKLLKIKKLDNVITSCPTEYVLTSDYNVEPINKGIITKYTLEKYLCGNLDDYSYKSLSSFIEYEPKVGIARDGTKTSKEGMLYRINLIRLKNLSFLVDYKGINLETEGFLKLGGQHRPSYYHQIQDIVKLNKNYLQQDDKYFKLYLLTPGLFSKGWLPKIVDEATMTLTYGNIKAKLITAAIGKSKYISGFDMKIKKPKPIYKVVPEGSVYYFELLEGTVQDVYQNFHLKSICDIDNAYVNRGFGITLVGRVNNW